MSGNQQTGIIFDRALRRGTTYDWSYISRPHPVTAPILFVSRDLFSDDPNGMGGRDTFFVPLGMWMVRMTIVRWSKPPEEQ